nr:site-2 protease family protein [Nanoarchaeota archaeon]
EQAGIETDVIYNRINNITITNIGDLIKVFDKIEVNETVIIGNNEKNYTITTTSRPDAPDQPVIGVTIQTRHTNEDNILIKIFLWFLGLFSWIFMLSLGLGLANLLPIGPVDGGRMLHVSLTRTLGKKKGTLIWTKITMIMIIIIAILLLTPILKAIMI